MSGGAFEVRRLAPSEVHLLQRDLSSWNTREYDRRLRAQERGRMLLRDQGRGDRRCMEAARVLYGALGYRHAHGPMISGTVLEGEDGRRIPVGGVVT